MKRKKLRLTPKQAEHMLFNVLEIGSRMLVSGAEVQRVENSIYRMCTAYGSETTEVFCMTYMIVVYNFLPSNLARSPCRDGFITFP